MKPRGQDRGPSGDWGVPEGKRVFREGSSGQLCQLWLDTDNYRLHLGTRMSGDSRESENGRVEERVKDGEVEAG